MGAFHERHHQVFKLERLENPKATSVISYSGMTTQAYHMLSIVLLELGRRKLSQMG